MGNLFISAPSMSDLPTSDDEEMVQALRGLLQRDTATTINTTSVGSPSVPSSLRGATSLPWCSWSVWWSPVQQPTFCVMGEPSPARGL